ncbi:MAG: bifunctional phosphopantothenoylcysteine decarboxylase/phosphopantothenate--cysteine ligase CoaBC [Candidatus Kryptonium sp.]|nr:bifunctional phosphopantothenoylcysteine decarboxylase/phosphopantothenate--cysteine ligase CoaBC [Candidatus Kryptonium sp.]MDW8108415.1 bifunctional phosphopantothenoylcysteine decarboxylase/phosphopantothenate--cysteine ligase CoaBC [Candidatus Kryptonium sp.]
MLEGKKIIVGVTGGISAYKTCYVVRGLKKLGADVKVVMTPSATQFVTPLTFSTLSGNDVIVDMFPTSSHQGTGARTWHIDLALWADLMLIAPATANTIAKIANGIADNFLTSLVLAMRCPVVLAPAMDVDMYLNEITQRNLKSLKELGYLIIDPEEGELASGLVGIGRMAEPEKIIEFVKEFFAGVKFDLKGKKFLITAGPTYELIDPVRFIGNWSTGKMGFEIAKSAVHRGAEVILVSGPTQLATPKNVKRIDVVTSDEMFEAVIKFYDEVDVVIMSAAVADYTPVYKFEKKLKKEDLSGEVVELKLKKTKDILKYLGEHKKNQVLVGFALETDNAVDNAMRKLKEKNLDLIVLNTLGEGSGFGYDTNIVTIISKDGEVESLPKMTKYEVGHRILDKVSQIFKKGEAMK